MSPKSREQTDRDAPQEETGERQLRPDPELEEALREAAASIDDRGSVIEITDGAEPDRAPERQREPEAKSGRESGGPIAPEKSETEQVEDLSAELIETKDRLLRLAADFDNFRRRALKEQQEALRYGHQNLVKDLLTVVDNLDRAIEHAERSEGGDLKSLLQGVELVRRELLAGLEKHGVTRVEARGQPFDPALHEAMAQAPDESVPPNTVVDVFQEGYVLRDRLLRPARVVVARAPEPGDGGEDGGGSGG